MTGRDFCRALDCMFLIGSYLAAQPSLTGPTERKHDKRTYRDTRRPCSRQFSVRSYLDTAQMIQSTLL